MQSNPLYLNPDSPELSDNFDQAAAKDAMMDHGTYLKLMLDNKVYISMSSEVGVGGAWFHVRDSALHILEGSAAEAVRQAFVLQFMKAEGAVQ